MKVDRRGVVGDRLWAVTDTDGRLGSGKTTRRFRTPTRGRSTRWAPTRSPTTSCCPGRPPRRRFGFVEDGWVGRRLQVGTAELSLSAAMPRCAMLGMAQDGLPDDRAVLQEVLSRHDGHGGLVADVHVAGSISVGDEVRLR